MQSIRPLPASTQNQVTVSIYNTRYASGGTSTIMFYGHQSTMGAIGGRKPNSCIRVRHKNLFNDNYSHNNQHTITYPVMIPGEIVDIIIDYLHDDKRSLATCGLICHKWYNRSRFHLFGSICLANNTQTLLYLPSTQSHLSVFPHIQSIQLAKGSNITLQVMKDALASLASVAKITSLKISSVMWVSTVLGQEMAGVQVLDFSGVMFKTLNSLREIVYHFPQLKALSLNVVDFEHPTSTAIERQRDGPVFLMDVLDLCCSPLTSGNIYKWLRNEWKGRGFVEIRNLH